MIDLHSKGVTLWSLSCGDSPQVLDRVVRVIKHCLRHFTFKKVLLFSYLPVDAPFEVVQVPKLDFDGLNIFINRIAPRYLDTAYAMSVHEDGFPDHPELWRDEFLDYDYIGAPWGDGVVGNGGFNIESHRLMDAKIKLPFYQKLDKEFDGRLIMASDAYLCRQHRDQLTRTGITFAPLRVAMKFSTEQRGRAWPSLGFHGRTVHITRYRTAWQWICEEEQCNT